MKLYIDICTYIRRDIYMYVYVNAGTSTKTSTNRSTIGRTLVVFGYKFERRVLNTSTKFEYEYEYEMIGGDIE